MRSAWSICVLQQPIFQILILGTWSEVIAFLNKDFEGITQDVTLVCHIQYVTYYMSNTVLVTKSII